jgi:hypothetical protein
LPIIDLASVHRPDVIAPRSTPNERADVFPASGTSNARISAERDEGFLE